MRPKTKVVTNPLQQTLMDYQYEYSPTDSLIKKITEHGEYTYEYDKLYRLLKATHPVLDNEYYTYDPLGNRLTASQESEEATYDANNALLSDNGAVFEYLNHNLVKKTKDNQVTHYNYNIENRLTQVKTDDTQLANYGYDPFGRRLWKEINGTKTYFLYSNEGLIGEYDENGVEIKSYGYSPDSPWTSDPLFQTQNGSYYWYQNDQLGTPQKLTDSHGNIVWEAYYKAFGEAQVETDLIDNPLRLPGQYFDAETELHYNYQRDYDWGGENPQNFSWISKNSDRLFVPVIELNPEVKNSISDMKVSMLTHMRTSWLKRGFFTSCVVKDGTCSE
jgi:large repetitive protein